MQTGAGEKRSSRRESCQSPFNKGPTEAVASPSVKMAPQKVRKSPVVKPKITRRDQPSPLLEITDSILSPTMVSWFLVRVCVEIMLKLRSQTDKVKKVAF